MLISLLSRRIAAVALITMFVVACASGPTQSSQVTINPGPVGGKIVAESGIDGGTASYSIHIDVPPGRNQTEPNFYVKYSSQAGNTLLGMGWFLNTPRSVFRCPAILAIDGYNSGVRYAKTDRLCLNGDHLVLISGTYGRSGSTYQEEVSDNSLIRLVGDIDSPSSYFVATLLDGDKSFYKKAVEQPGRNAPLTWYMSRYVDTHGNTVDYYYDDTVPGETLLSEIRYTGLEIKGVEKPGTHFVRFSYEARPDVTSSFLAGGESRQTRRLSAIVVGIDAEHGAKTPRETREYKFAYTQSAATGRSLLSEIRECIVGDDGVKQWLPPTHFTWENGPIKFNDPVAYAIPNLDKNLQPIQFVDATSTLRPPYIVSGDYDGDGRREVIYYRPGIGAHLYFMNPDGTLRKDVDISKLFQGPSQALFNSSAVDINNDGASDLPGDSNGHLAFSSWNGTDMGAPVATDIPYSASVEFTYVSGGRQPDVLQIEPMKPGSADEGLFLYRNQGSRPGALRFAPRQLIYAMKSRKSGSAVEQEKFRAIGDIDGNGLVDILIMSGRHIVNVIFPRQDASGSLHFDVATPASIGLVDRDFDEETYYADINGDGLFDVVYSDGPAGAAKTWRYQLNSGGHFQAPVNTLVRDERPDAQAIPSTFVADIDNDGADEILYPEKMLVPYCLGSVRKVGHGTSIDQYQCADDKSGMQSPFDDLSIYRFAVLKFKASSSGRFSPIVDPDSNVIAQGILISTGDVHGDGLTDVLSPFTAWYANGRFRDRDGKFSVCPAVYGCGLHVSSNSNAAHKDSVDAAADLMLSAVDGLGRRTFWDYYPISTTKAGFYSIKPVGSPARYINGDDYYFTSSMYLVGAYGTSSGVGDGYYAYTYQYGDEIYDNAGRGLLGFRYDIEHDLSEKYRLISIFDQRFPLDGNLLAQWKVKEDTKDDGLAKGAPPPDHAYALVKTWDCEAPKGFSRPGGLQCIDSEGPVFRYRLRHKTDHDWDDKLKEWTDVDVRYDYDIFANETRRTTKTTSSKKIETVDITTRYAPPDLRDWVIGRQIEQKTENITEVLPTKDAKGSKTQTDEDDIYKYDDRGWLNQVIQRGPEAYIETRTLSYYDDPAVSNYGELSTVSISRAPKEGAPADYLQTVHIGYDASDYFATSFTTVGADSRNIVYDPVTGNVLHEVDGDVTEDYTYDILGHVIHYKKTEKGKDPFEWDADYYKCVPDKKCIEDAVYAVMETINNRLIVYTYYDKRGKKIDSPSESLLKDD